MPLPPDTGTHDGEEVSDFSPDGNGTTRALDRPRAWPAWTLFGAIVIVISASLVAEIWILPTTVARTIDTFPETRPFVGYGLAWAILAFSCWQALLILVLVAVQAHRRHRPIRTVLRAMLGLLVAIVLLAAAGFVALTALAFATPGVMLGLIAMAALGIVGIVAVSAVNPKR